MRRLATPVLVLLSASTLFLGACSKDSSDTTAVAETEAVATDAAVETTAAAETEAMASDAAATEAAATDAAAGSDAADAGDAAVTQLLGAIGADASPETLDCLRKDAPDFSTAVTASGPSPELLRGLINCTPDALYTGTAGSLKQSNPEVTDEQAKCIVTSYYQVLASKDAETFASLMAAGDTVNLPQDVKDEIAAGAADCGLDADALMKVINTK